MKKTLFLLFVTLVMLNCKDNVNNFDETRDLDPITSTRLCAQSCESFDPYFNNDDGCILDLTIFEYSEPTTLFFNISSAYFDNVAGLGDFDPNLTIECPGGSFVSGEANIVRIPCGTALQVQYPEPIGGCSGWSYLCHEPCCIKNCCNETRVTINQYTPPIAEKKCCYYEVDVYNGSDCNATLTYGVSPQLINDFVPPYGYKTVQLDICPTVLGPPPVGIVTLTTDDGNVCFEKEIECNCCPLLDVVIAEREPDSDLDCCFYTVELTNRSDCDVEIQNKFGQPIINISSGETKRTFQKACDGDDFEYPVVVISADGTRQECESITLPGKC